MVYEDQVQVKNFYGSKVYDGHPVHSFGVYVHCGDKKILCKYNIYQVFDGQLQPLEEKKVTVKLKFEI